MRFRGFLEEVAGSRSKSRLLGTVLAFPGKEWTGRELARQAGVSQPQAGVALEALKNNGLVESRSAGKARLWKLNGKNFLAKLLEGAARPLEEAKKLLAREFVGKIGADKVRKIILFGSVARGEERTDSDIDLLIIVGTKRDKQEAQRKALEKALELAGAFGSSPVVPIVYSEREAAQKAGSALMKKIAREALTIYPSQDGKTE